MASYSYTNTTSGIVIVGSTRFQPGESKTFSTSQAALDAQVPGQLSRTRDGVQDNNPYDDVDPYVRLTASRNELLLGTNKVAMVGVAAALHQLNAKAVTEQNRSVVNSRIGYEDTAASLFAESWASANANWTQGANPCQVSGNRLYAGASQGSGSGQNHSYALSASDNMRAVFNLNVPSGTSSGGVIIGVSSATAGSAPAAGANDAFGLYLNSGVGVTFKQISNGSTTDQSAIIAAGDYVVTVCVDQTYISVTACKTDGTVEVTVRRLRSGFAVNNLYVFNSDVRQLSGMSVGIGAARKGLQTITPRTGIEGVAKTMHWSGDGTNSWLVFLPANYDSRKPSPVVMCFHGNGTDETAWYTNGNYQSVQRALVNAGYIVLSCSLNSSKTTWGNTASTDAYYAAYKFLRDNYAIGPISIFANSMGGIESLNALAANKIPGVVAYAATSATVSLAENYANPLFTSVITSAYGISGDYDAKTAGKDPLLLPEYSFRQLPMLFITATDDASVTPSANTLAFVPKMQNVSPSVTSVLTTGGHSFAVSPFLSQITTFFDTYNKSV